MFTYIVQEVDPSGKGEIALIGGEKWVPPKGGNPPRNPAGEGLTLPDDSNGTNGYEFSRIKVTTSGNGSMIRHKQLFC